MEKEEVIQVHEDLPAYIIGLPIDRFEADLAESKLADTVARVFIIICTLGGIVFIVVNVILLQQVFANEVADLTKLLTTIHPECIFRTRKVNGHHILDGL